MPNTPPKKSGLRRYSRILLKRPKSFKSFLDAHQVPVKDLPDALKHPEDSKLGISRAVMEEHYRTLRAHRYHEWLQSAESLMYQEVPSKNGLIRLMMGLDYKKLYDALLFEFHHYMTRACFCKLAQHYKVASNPRALSCELKASIVHLRTLLQENQGLSKSKAFQALFTHAYRSALVDLCLYHKVDADPLDAPLFTLSILTQNKGINHVD